jgi:hypothetical protein
VSKFRALRFLLQTPCAAHEVLINQLAKVKIAMARYLSDMQCSAKVETNFSIVNNKIEEKYK